MFPNGVELIVSDGTDNGIWFEGEKGEFFVSRELANDKATAIDDSTTKPIPEEELVKLCKGKKPGNHMGNFFECVRTARSRSRTSTRTIGR